MRLLAAALLVMALSGCTDDASSATDTADVLDGHAEATWVMEEIHRDVVTTSNAAVYGITDDTDSFGVKSNATLLVVNVTVTMDTPNKLSVRFAPPGCDTLRGSCSHYVVTDGEGQLVVDDPIPGEWSISAFADVGVASGSYHLVVGQSLAGDALDMDEDNHPCDAC